MLKTPVSELQEMMTKNNESLEFEYISQSGPGHSLVFEVECRARGMRAIGRASTKRQAKHESAKLMLEKVLSGRALPQSENEPSPTPLNEPPPPVAPASTAKVYVALLGELCEQYRLGAVQYTEVSREGPPHAPIFGVQAAVGAQRKTVLGPSKQAARHGAAKELYQFLRQNLQRSTSDFSESEALSRAHERVMARYEEAKGEQRPTLAMRVSDYYDALRQLPTEQVEAAREAMRAQLGVQPVLQALGFQAKEDSLPADDGQVLTLELEGATPALVVGGASHALLDDTAVLLLHRVLRPKPMPTLH